MAQKNKKTTQGRAKSPAPAAGKSGAAAARGGFGRLVVLLVLLFSAFGAYQYAPGRVLSVTDGDTISVFTSERELVKLRLYGVDAPEGDQPGGQEATDFVRGLLFLQEVDFSVLGTDQYGRTLALVKLPDGRILNEELVREGQAWVYRSYCKESFCADWIHLELAARKNKSGLWSETRPTAPWYWRKRNN